MTSRPEQREHARHKVTLPLLVRDTTAQVAATIEFDTQDLSVGGAFIRSDFLFEIGETLQLKFQVQGKLLQLRGTVVRVVRESEEGAPGMGVKFADLAKHDADTIAEYLKSQAQKAS